MFNCGPQETEQPAREHPNGPNKVISSVASRLIRTARDPWERRPAAETRRTLRPAVANDAPSPPTSPPTSPHGGLQALLGRTDGGSDGRRKIGGDTQTENVLSRDSQVSEIVTGTGVGS